MSNEIMERDTQELIDKIVAENDPEELEKITRKYQQIQLKKGMLRGLQLQNAISMLDDELILRLRDNPDQMSDKAVVAYMQATQAAINSVNQQIDKTPTAVIQVNNIEVADSNPLGLNSASRQKVLGLLQKIVNNKEEDKDIIDL